VTSIKEGWGLNVIEAGACGTPTVAYNVPGLRDSVKNGVTGVLCAPNPDKMACAIVDLWIDKKVLMTYSKNALDNSRQFNWDKSAKDLTNILDKIIFE
jgi:glycosyltransferase involved in cell wall biosynthesis